MAVCRENMRLVSGRWTHPATASAARRNRNGHGRNETARAIVIEVHLLMTSYLRWNCSSRTACRPFPSTRINSWRHPTRMPRTPDDDARDEKPFATFGEAETGDVAWLRYVGTFKRKGESTESKNINLQGRNRSCPYQ
jgi:hypothetical protein